MPDRSPRCACLRGIVVAVAFALVPLVGAEPSAASGVRDGEFALRTAQHANALGFHAAIEKTPEKPVAGSAKTIADPMRTWSLERHDLARILPSGSHIRDCLRGFCTLTSDAADVARRAALNAGASPPEIHFDLVRVRHAILEDERICLHDGLREDRGGADRTRRYSTKRPRSPRTSPRGSTSTASACARTSWARSRYRNRRRACSSERASRPPAPAAGRRASKRETRRCRSTAALSARRRRRAARARGATDRRAAPAS